MVLGKRHDGFIAGMSPIRHMPDLDVIDEDHDESGPFKDQSLLALRSQKKQYGQGLLKLHNMKDSLESKECNFSDLSSIHAVPLDLKEEVAPFTPVTGVACMQAIPVSMQILKELADKVVENDVAFEKKSRKWAIRSAISQAWTMAFNNQVSEFIRRG